MDKYFRNRITGEAVTREDIQGGRANIALPLVFKESSLDNLSLDVVKETEAPADTDIKTYVWVPLQLPDGTWEQSWVPQYRFIGESLVEPLRASVSNLISKRHKAKRDGGITFNGHKVGTDLTARTIMSMLGGQVGDKNVVIKGTPRSLTKGEYSELIKAVDEHVAKCDSKEWALTIKLVGAKTLAELEAVEAEVGKEFS